MLGTHSVEAPAVDPELKVFLQKYRDPPTTYPFLDDDQTSQEEMSVQPHTKKAFLSKNLLGGYDRSKVSLASTPG
jgi:hypothetical protein